MTTAGQPDDQPPGRVTRDRVYPRCVWCGGENYLPAVLAYGAGERPCAAVPGCGRYLPEHYRRKDADHDQLS
jgi:hypothetical protein